MCSTVERFNVHPYFVLERSRTGNPPACSTKKGRSFLTWSEVPRKALCSSAVHTNHWALMLQVSHVMMAALSLPVSRGPLCLLLMLQLSFQVTRQGINCRSSLVRLPLGPRLVPDRIVNSSWLPPAGPPLPFFPLVFRWAVLTVLIIRKHVAHSILWVVGWRRLGILIAPSARLRLTHCVGGNSSLCLGGVSEMKNLAREGV